MTKPFERVLIVMFENQYRSYVIRNPFLRKLAAAGADMTNYFGAFHPSQTNYLASLAGDVCGVTNDTPPPAPLPQQTLVDLLEPAGISWKAYMEGYPGDPWKPIWQDPSYPEKDQPLNEYPEKGPNLARYFRKHNAFASFHSIQRDEQRWNKIVDEAAFWNDVAKGTLPEYGWFTPDIWNDGHYLYNTHVDTNPRTELVPQVAGWLEYVFLGKIKADKVQGGASPAAPDDLGLELDVDLLLTDPATAWKNSRFPEGTLLVITFDEADYDAEGYDTNYDGPNQIYTVLLGEMIPPGTVVSPPYNHYSLISTIEKNFGLGDLGKNDRDAAWLRFLWDEKFSWSDVAEVGRSATGDLALACLGDAAHLVYGDGNGGLVASIFEGNAWSTPEPTGLSGANSLAMATANGMLTLVFAGEGDALYCATSDGTGWSDAVALDQTTAGGIALTAYLDHADGKEKLMLAWQTANGFMEYLILEDGQPQGAAGEVGQLTDGPMVLGQLGPSVYLVYKERNTRHMRITSFNTGPFNAFKAQAFDDSADPNNDTTLHAWAPADFHVGHFAKKMAALQNDYQALGKLAMATIEGEMHLVHRAAYDDTPTAYTEVFGLTGIFTAASQLTNGNGTLNQAGWTLEQEMPEVQLDPGSGIAMASNGKRLLLVWQESQTGELKYRSGGYSSASPSS